MSDIVFGTSFRINNPEVNSLESTTIFSLDLEVFEKSMIFLSDKFDSPSAINASFNQELSAT